MPFPALEEYLARLAGVAPVPGSIRLDGQGRAQGRYFNVSLTSAFQAIHVLGSEHIVGYDGLARSHSNSDQGLSLWRLLDHAANDEESVVLDRLCRMLHAINFFRQEPSPDFDLYLSVHARLLAAVDDHHGTAFRRVLNVLELPHERIVLQLPTVTQDRGWLLDVVAENYRRNGFQLALNAADARGALQLLKHFLPAVIKVDAREINDEVATLRLLQECARRGVRLIFKRVESQACHATLLRLGAQTQQLILAQGFLWDLPAASLRTPYCAGKATDSLAAETALASGLVQHAWRHA